MTEMFGKEYIVKVTNDGECVTMQEVVRCKDCVFREGNVCRLYIVERHEVDDDDFCSEAERKEHG